MLREVNPKFSFSELSRNSYKRFLVFFEDLTSIEVDATHKVFATQYAKSKYNKRVRKIETVYKYCDLR